MNSIGIPIKICKVYPNGEFTIGYDSAKRATALGGKEEAPEDISWDSASEELKAELKAVAAATAMDVGSSLVVNSPKQRRGLNGISTRAARDVRNMAHVLQTETPKERLSFVTLTIPQMSQEDNLSVCENWHLIVKDFFKSLGRLYKRKSGREFEYVAVTEIQEKRYERTEFIGLHLHFVCVGKLQRSSNWILTPTEIRDKWKRAAENHCIEDYDWSASENCQRVRKDASGYLGKYLSKGVKSAGKIRASGRERYLPYTWYSRSISLLRRVKKATIRDREIAEFLTAVFCRRLTLQSVSFYREICIESPSFGEMVIGYVGKFRFHPNGMGADNLLRKILFEETNHENIHAT